MNSMKTFFILGVLAAVAYVAYVAITKNAETTAMRDAAPAWSDAPSAGLPDPNVTVPQFGTGSAQPGMPGAPGGLTASPAMGTAPGTLEGAVGGPGSRAGYPSPTAGPYANGASSFVPPDVAPAAVAVNDGLPTANYPQTDSYPQTANAAPFANLSSPQSAPNSLQRSRQEAYPSHTQSGPTDVFQPPASQPFASRAPVDPLSSSRPAPRDNREKYANFMQTVQSKLDEGRLAEAHLALSTLYDSPDTPVELDRQVVDLLDQLAGSVIYSQQHLLEPEYMVRPGETLEQIAQAHYVPWQLLVRINGIRDPQNLQPGQKLKVVRGPFSAVIDLTKYELTLMLKGRYAGRFPIGVGRDYASLAGSYVVSDKTINPRYFGPDQMEIAADDPNNPYGAFWIGLSTQDGQPCGAGIHGTNDPANLHRTGSRGAICLDRQDIDDLFGILSVGSRVVIRDRESVDESVDNAVMVPGRTVR